MKVTKTVSLPLSENFRTFKRTVRSLHVCDVDVGTLSRFGRDIYNMEIVAPIPKRERASYQDNHRHYALRTHNSICHVIGIRGLGALAQL